jgi:hypothetical protein
MTPTALHHFSTSLSTIDEMEKNAFIPALAAGFRALGSAFKVFRGARKGAKGFRTTPLFGKKIEAIPGLSLKRSLGLASKEMTPAAWAAGGILGAGALGAGALGSRMLRGRPRPQQQHYYR